MYQHRHGSYPFFSVDIIRIMIQNTNGQLIMKVVSSKLVSKWLLICDDKNVNVVAQMQVILKMCDNYTRDVLEIPNGTLLLIV